MEVPLRLARRETATRADAFLLVAEDTTALVDAVARFGGETAPEVFSVRGGFVLVPRSGETRPLPGAVRLRRLAGDLFIPADADLIPALLPDEARSLTRDRGLVVLPGGEVLAFDPSQPLAVSQWLQPSGVRRDEWVPFPRRPARPDTLNVIERPSPPTAALEVLAAGAPDDASPLPGAGESGAAGPVPEDARPPSGSLIRRAAAGAGFAAGGFLAWLGRQLGSNGLARLGGNLARKALEAVPRLSERLLGEQEAALREVLRQLRSGDVEKGLTRAPIAVPDPDGPARLGTDARLGTRDPRYSLRDLVGSGGGIGTAWLGGGDVWAELAREYRRLAQVAAARGDFRRAAYLYGVLLRDLRSAANVLMAGGLFRDAALIYRDRLNEPQAAAVAFERAGDYDEALRLFERLGQFEKCGDLLRRLGDDERAVTYYLRAAETLAERGQWLTAGDLVRGKVGRWEPAAVYYRSGWLGETAEAVGCGQRLFDEHLAAADWPGMNRLLDEAETHLANRPTDAGTFFNHSLKVGADHMPVDVRDDLADRVRLVFAGHLRGAVKPAAARLAEELFPRHWPAPVGRDAAFAVRGRTQSPAETPDHPPPVKLAEGTVTAVAVARGTGDVFVAPTENIVCWRVTSGRVVTVGKPRPGRVTALSVDVAGEIVYALHTDGPQFLLPCFAADRAGNFAKMGELAGVTRGEPAAEVCYLQPCPSFRDGDFRVTLVTDAGWETFSGRYLTLCTGNEPFRAVGGGAHLLAANAGVAWEWVEGAVRYLSQAPSDGVLTPFRWRQPWMPAFGTVVDWFTSAARLEVCGIDREQHLRWAEFDARADVEPWSQIRTAPDTNQYRAACLVQPGVVAAVTDRNEVHWFRVATAGLEQWAVSKLGVPARAFAVVARASAGEVVVILADGSAVRVPRP